ncbi:MAG TPA: HAD family phosphatase [Bryobacteraceae bacterium]|nr:HAD family phosphatase [Bryobacteraceae bacterium]
MRNSLALIFDMDGVIVDSTAVHTESWRRYLGRHGITIEDIESRMLGRHNDEIVRDFFAATELTDEAVLHHGYEKERLYRSLMAPRLADHLVPGAADFIRRHAHLPLAVASNAEPANVDVLLEAAGIRHLFRAVINGHDVARPKPFPDIFLRAAELLSTAPADCVVFEDSAIGVAAARAAGMRVIGVTTTFREMTGVDLVVANFEDGEVERWLRELPVPA